MTSAFLSQDWYRVASLKPRLREHVEIHRHRLRGQTWHIVQDLHTGNYHRISPAGNIMISLMDGRRSVQKLWEIACDRFEEHSRWRLPPVTRVVGASSSLPATRTKLRWLQKSKFWQWRT